jgi:hypothetical protein
MIYPQSEIEQEPVEVSHGFYIGCDVGQAQDYSALVAVEHKTNLEGMHEFHVRYCSRLPLGTPYGKVVSAAAQLVDYLKQYGPVVLGVDATGCGRPLIEAMRERKLKPVAITVTGGMTAHRENGFLLIPKKELISSASLLLGRGQLKIAKDIQFRDTLLNELENYAVKVNIATGAESYEAWKTSIHDDLTFSLCICCFLALKESRKTGKTITPIIEMEKSGTHTDPTLISAMREAQKGGRWAGLTGFRE